MHSTFLVLERRGSLCCFFELQNGKMKCAHNSKSIFLILILRLLFESGPYSRATVIGAGTVHLYSYWYHFTSGHNCYHNFHNVKLESKIKSSNGTWNGSNRCQSWLNYHRLSCEIFYGKIRRKILQPSHLHGWTLDFFWSPHFYYPHQP